VINLSSVLDLVEILSLSVLLVRNRRSLPNDLPVRKFFVQDSSLGSESIFGSLLPPDPGGVSSDVDERYE